MRLKTILVGTFVAACLLPGVASAGFPECNNIRLEDVKNCELRGSIKCMAGCSEFGVYKTACATRLQTTCRQECTLKPELTCQDSCTVRCDMDCAKGINVICIHNCFAECVGSCDAKCAGSAKPEQCRATCEANCDGSCDIQCKPVVNASCYQHCVECCGGSCTAQANMDCQNVCQDRTFEDCEREFRVNCDASCGADGALFCDGKFIMSGAMVQPCVKALIERGKFMVEGQAMGEVTLGGDGGGFSCSMGRAGGRGSALGLAAFCVMGLLLGARRRRTARAG